MISAKNEETIHTIYIYKYIEREREFHIVSTFHVAHFVLESRHQMTRRCENLAADIAIMLQFSLDCALLVTVVY